MCPFQMPNETVGLLEAYLAGLQDAGSINAT